ncbi:hypothetical protein [Fundidesulfovibrio soli]|uniref:hypothetical protein n=1 Tax=Fundidesulfovibrio soli TaxID=2922716 RepID=UPI001FAF078A|nr:hypothetical protein [Fundidesulfovibrio soli]
MNVDAKAIEAKIRSMFPEIVEYGVTLEVIEDPRMDSWEVRLGKGQNSMSSCLDNEDVRKCLGGEECTAFAAELRQFVHSYCRHSKECPVGG